jgi:hypothetical protein
MSLYPRGESFRYPFDKRLGGLLNRSGHYGEKKNLGSAGNRTPVVEPVILSLHRLRYPGCLSGSLSLSLSLSPYIYIYIHMCTYACMWVTFRFHTTVTMNDWCDAHSILNGKFSTGNTSNIFYRFENHRSKKTRWSVISENYNYCDVLGWYTRLTRRVLVWMIGFISS